MRGDQKVIEQLNAALSAEVTLIAQYMVQAGMCESWGYHRLGGLTKARAIQEMHHAERFIERIIFLDGTPNIDIPLTPKVGASVQQQLEIDYADEADAVRLFESIIQDEERHADFLEAQTHAIREIGIGSYLSQQLQAL
jgi:bacterioferritin